MSFPEWQHSKKGKMNHVMWHAHYKRYFQFESSNVAIEGADEQHLNCCSELLNSFFIIYYQNQCICTERRRKRDYQDDHHNKQLCVRGQRKHMKVEVNVSAHTRKISLSNAQHLCRTPRIERAKVLRNPSASTNTSVSGIAAEHMSNISHSSWLAVHILNQNALQGLL